ncbi:hypothetical protein QF000_000489 [Paraburkholderia atlantica]|uniref:Uncharacterized protein n=1 Tax=Paraburkholderia atlantica TaxID=2654982 RepID=A0A6I1Q1S7_PARAM|nr:hypothetical protein [Paraburkholderia atlantica]MBB5421588.1 hypothetical protein [Paraburkholderia atlantica]MBB5429492.1 hypothetical protein [Paraburkholderia atlantica]MPW11446.1 hypothetical protein [Paraburkholderia atlantica]NUY35928.1 hypothetical protein [Paraburkholderia atlantica]
MNASAISLNWPRLLVPQTEMAMDTHRHLSAHARARVNFTSQEAQARWDASFQRSAQATLSTELEAVRRGIVGATLVWAPFASLQAVLDHAKHADLSVSVRETAPDALLHVPVMQDGTECDAREFAVYCLLIEANRKDGPQETSLDSMSPSLLLDRGFPACCAQAWSQALNAGWRDAIAKTLAENGPISPLAALATLGIGPLRHVPCSPTCTASSHAVSHFSDLAKEIGFAGEASLWETWSDMPTRATVRSGIVEVTTPEWRFAYRAPGRVARQAVALAGPRRRWYASPAIAQSIQGCCDGQFADEFARRSRWSTVVWEQSSLLARTSGPVVHLDCGEGLLLELAALMRPSREIAGIDPSPALVSNARERLGNSAALAIGDWITKHGALVQFRARAGMVLLDPERLADTSIENRQELFAGLAAMRADAIVIVATDRALARFRDIDHLAAAAGLGVDAGHARRVSARVVGFI